MCGGGDTKRKNEGGRMNEGNGEFWILNCGGVAGCRLWVLGYELRGDKIISVLSSLSKCDDHNN